MTTYLYRLGRFAARHPRPVIGLWLLAAVLVIGGSATVGGDLEDSFEVPGLDSQVAVDLLSSADSDVAGITAQVVATPADPDATLFDEPRRVAELADLTDRLAALPNVLAVSDPADAIRAGPDVAAASGTVSPDGRVALIQIQYPVVEELGKDDLDRLVETVEEARVDSPLRLEMRGDLFFSFEEPETGLGEMIGIVVAVIVLLVAFGSLIAMGLPIGLALFGLVVGVSSMSLVTHVVEIPSWAPQIASMVGLGVGIDYALFLVTRHRELLAQGVPVVDAAGRAVATAGQAVVFAGGTVVIAILGLGVAGVPFVTAAGIATSIIVAIMVVASVTLLPAFLGLAGHRIDRFQFRLPGRRRSTAADVETGSVAAGSGWDRWGRHVSAHPWAYGIGVTALLLAMTAPILSLELGFPDEGTLPESRTERRAYDLVADGFGDGVNGPFVIAVDLSATDDAATDVTTALLDQLTAAVAADPGIAGVSPVDGDGTVASFAAIPTTSPQDAATLATVERLRSDVFPEVLGGTEVTAHVGGMTAGFGDIAARVTDRLPYFIAAVIALSFLLLTLVFRSILVPLKAAILNLLSIGAAYGVMVMVFQWGWGASLIGLETTIPVVSFIPMFMFAILFGLSMDYEVFLLSRVREEYVATGDNDASVIHGIAVTARVITSAALIMISVFLGFVVSTDPTTKMFGLGLATAILVDATIVRLVLVPATMTLMGDANWWLPRWLDRVLPRIDLEGGSVEFDDTRSVERVADQRPQAHAEAVGVETAGQVDGEEAAPGEIELAVARE